MFTANECVFALSAGCRALVSQEASKEKHRWLAGTCSTADNELSVLEFDEDSNTLSLAGSYAHPNQIWSMDSSPVDTSLVVTTHLSKSGECGANLWRMPGQVTAEVNAVRSHDDDARKLYDRSVNPAKEKIEDLGELTCSSATGAPGALPLQSSVKWHSTEDQILTTSDGNVHTYALTDDGCPKHTVSMTLNNQGASTSTSASAIKCGAVWDPHSPQSAYAVYGSNVYLLDARAASQASSSSSSYPGCASRSNLLSIDCNPNRPSTIVTAGEDRLVRLWDTRHMACPVKTLAGHSHWASCVKFNPWHDQLLISSGSDNIVNLWRVASCSSAPWLGAAGEEAVRDSLGSDTMVQSSKDGEREERRPRSNSRGSTRSNITSSSFTDDAGSEDSLSMDPPDVLISALPNQHVESVYACAWGSADAWVFASVSHDGRVAVNQVPSNEKYKILL